MQVLGDSRLGWPRLWSTGRCIDSDVRGSITVALLGKEHLDVHDVDLTSLELDGVSLRSHDWWNWSYADVNRNGITDLVLRFRDRDVNDEGDTFARQAGTLDDGAQPFEAGASLCVLGEGLLW